MEAAEIFKRSGGGGPKPVAAVKPIVRSTIPEPEANAAATSSNLNLLDNILSNQSQMLKPSAESNFVTVEKKEKAQVNNAKK